ncbi:MAG: glycosyltransferase family 2 protein [Nocardioidaceae bacterium]|nr:glycosyltransferase family 2 protein [Nocardioidaceae bacterium]MCL2613104.1 glycosyltransferase family 2 protein [Nocardioidaceae bacterium]
MSAPQGQVTPDRIVTATTLRDTPDNVDRFVRRTLGSGVDHAIVFLDADQPKVRAALEANPHVTVVRTGKDYWLGDRPSVVLDRQMANASVAAAALAEVPSVRWVFNIDGDEVLDIDRAALARIETDAVRLGTLEAVAKRKWRRSEPEMFKRVPSSNELHALSALKLIDAPEISAFFRGHSLGKVGVRPGADVRFRLHTAYRLPEVEIEETVQEDMHLLHLESWCLADFVSRWQGYRADRPKHRPHRDERLGAAYSLIDGDTSIGAAERDKRLGELFDRLVADDRAVLKRFDLQVRVRRREVAPRPLDRSDVAALEAALARIGAESKEGYRPTVLEAEQKAASAV